MFSNKENINILTSLLIAHGVKNAVVCPGSRNAAIVNNLNECDNIKCYPVTDERSAGFYALGIAQATDSPVVICVTSGTALLNLAPAVAEAFYQKQRIIVISADRPQEWIDQLDGQTLPQVEALGRFVKTCVTLPEPKNDTEEWYCNRLVNEALLESCRDGGGPVHINVPISEPLFDFTLDKLPLQRKVSCINAVSDVDTICREMVSNFFEARKPMVVIGQMHYISSADSLINAIRNYAVVINERLSPFDNNVPFDEILYDKDTDNELMPDFILYLGGTLVSKRIKKFLRKVKDVECWSVSEDGNIHDIFMNMNGVIHGNPYDVLAALNESIGKKDSADDVDAFDLLTDSPQAYYKRWQMLTDTVLSTRDENFVPDYSEMMAVREFEQQVQDMDYDFQVHYANSMAVRLGNVYADHYIYVNRGVNGIDGSISTAAGYSLASEDMVFCVTGDLSFFYDQNALWNKNIGANFRILLLNNNCGGIFSQLDGLKDSAAFDSMVTGSHRTSAHGMCDENDIGYLCAHNADELHDKMIVFLTAGTKRPLLLEVFTDPDNDAKVYHDYYETIKKAIEG